MHIAIIAGRNTDHVKSNAAKNVDYNSYEGFPDIDTFIHHIELTHIEFNRAIIIDGGRMNSGDIATLGEFSESVCPTMEIVFVCTREEVSKDFASIIETPLSVSIYREGGSITNSFIRDIATNRIDELRDKCGVVYEKPSVAVSESVQVSRRPAAASGMPSLNLAVAGQTHSDTGFLQNDEEAGIPEQLTVTSWGSTPEEFPGFDADSEDDFPYVNCGTRVVISFSSTPGYSTRHAATQAITLSDDGSHSVLFADVQSGTEHGLVEILDDENSVELYQPNIQRNVYLPDGSISIATNGINSETSDADVRAIIEAIPRFDFTVIDMNYDKAHMIPEIVKAFPSTTILHVFTENKLKTYLNDLLMPNVLPTETLRVFETHMWPHPGKVFGPNSSSRLGKILSRAIWDRADLYERLLPLAG